jgi:hypothetical protein
MTCTSKSLMCFLFSFLMLFVSEMADIVGKQGTQIDNIHKTTEESHSRAEAGLEQVKQAASYQPTCILS